MEISGSGPLILGYGTADFAKYPSYHGQIYRLKTLFRHCIGKKITEVKIDAGEDSMFFPCYCGIDMSQEDEGVYGLRFLLDDGSTLSFAGEWDFFSVEHTDSKGEIREVPFSVLLWELDPETREQMLRGE